MIAIPNENVDIISPYPGGYAINNFETGEWLEYSINVAQSGTYRLDALVSSVFSNSSFHMEIDGVDQTGVVAVPSTGSWGTFQLVGVGGVYTAQPSASTTILVSCPRVVKL